MAQRGSRYILAIDQGTTGTTVLVVDKKLAVRAKVNQEFPQTFPKPGWVEHNLEDIWRSVTSTIPRALKAARVKASEIAGIGITNQRETAGIWDAAGSTDRPAQSCGNAGAPPQSVRSSSRPATKARPLQDRAGARPVFLRHQGPWLLDNVKGARGKAEAGGLAFGTIDSFLTYRLTGGSGPCHRREQRLPHLALQHSLSSMG